MIDQVSKRYGKQSQPAVDELSLSVGEKEILAIVGESGSGKSTLLRLVSGLEVPDSGTVSVHGETVASAKAWLPPEKREIGFVFQDGALFPHLTIADNVVYGLSRKQSRSDRDTLVKEHLELVGLSGFEQRYPSQLSGGERQRVALARALAPKPKLLLLDEPFSNLDPSLRRGMREEISDILHRVGTTALMVTHDTEDALIVGDRIAIVRDGKIEQLGTPQQVYQSPNNTYCAQLFGPAFAIGDQILRPHQVQLTKSKGEAGIEVTIRRLQQLGERSEAVVEPVDSKTTTTWVVELAADDDDWKSGAKAWVHRR